MKWSNLVSLTLFSCLVSMPVHAQPAGAPAAPSSSQQSPAAADSMSIEDSGGNLKIAPKTQQQGVAPQQMPPDQGMANQPPSADSVDVNPNPPQGELQVPSNTNQNMVPAGPQQDSMPDPTNGSMQN